MPGSHWRGRPSNGTHLLEVPNQRQLLLEHLQGLFRVFSGDPLHHVGEVAIKDARGYSRLLRIKGNWCPCLSISLGDSLSIPKKIFQSK